MDYSLSTLTTFLLRMFEVFAEFSIIFNSFNKKIKPLHFALAIFLCNAIAQFLKPIVPYSIYWIIPPILIFSFSMLFIKSKWQKVLMETCQD